MVLQKNSTVDQGWNLSSLNIILNKHIIFSSTFEN